MPLNPSGETVIATQWALLSIATGVILARLYLRLILQRRRLLLSDVFMCAAWASAVTLAASDIVFYRIGVLRRGITLNLIGYEGSPEDVERFYKIYYFTNYPFHTTFYLSKAALLSVYLQIFPDFMVKRRRFLWATIIYVAVGYATTILVLSLSCLPTWRNWTLSDERCSIEVIKVTFEISWALNITGDILIFILPWLVIPELVLRKNLRYSLYATFLLGLINIIFCIVRFAQIEQYGADLVITISLVELWSFIDACIGLIIACLPSLRPYFNLRQQREYYGHSSGQYSKGDSEHNSGRPMLSSAPDNLSQPSNVHMSEDMQRIFSVV